MRYLLDTNIVGYYLRRASPALEAKLSEALKHHNTAISVITRAELRYGQAGMTAEDRRRGLIDSFFLRLPSLEWSVQAFDIYGALKDKLKRQGATTGDNRPRRMNSKQLWTELQPDAVHPAQSRGNGKQAPATGRATLGRW